MPMIKQQKRAECQIGKSDAAVHVCVFLCLSPDICKSNQINIIHLQFEAFLHSSFFAKDVFCLGQKQGVLVNNGCSS